MQYPKVDKCGSDRKHTLLGDGTTCGFALKAPSALHLYNSLELVSDTIAPETLC